MSRIGQQLISVPSGAKVDLTPTTIKITGPKGELSQALPSEVVVTLAGDTLTVKRSKETKLAHSLHGTIHRLIENMLVGVTDGFTKNLELIGTGYRAAKQGDKLVLSLGFSHPIEFHSPPGVKVEVEANTKIAITGIDKQLVGQVAANIRAFRPPEPYKGKGVRYSDEHVRRKAGKTAKAAA